MKRINEAISEKYPAFTKGQRTLAAYVTEHCDKAAFMSSFELADAAGVSQSTVMRFAVALGYGGYGDFQQAMQNELQGRLTTLSGFEKQEEKSEDRDAFERIAATDAVNIKKNIDLNDMDAIRNLCMRLNFSSKIYIYGQGYASIAAQYLSGYLRVILRNVCDVNHTAIEPLAAIADIDAGDLLLLISFPVHTDNTKRMAAYARHRGAGVATISEGTHSEIADYADLNLVSEYGDYGLNGTMAPLISLCGSIVSMLIRGDEKAQKKLRLSEEATTFRLEDLS